MALPAKHLLAAEWLDETADLYTIHVSAAVLEQGLGYAATLVVRQLPSNAEVLSTASPADGGWATPQDALAAALARGRRFVREHVLAAHAVH